MGMNGEGNGGTYSKGALSRFAFLETCCSDRAADFALGAAGFGLAFIFVFGVAAALQPLDAELASATFAASIGGLASCILSLALATTDLMNAH